MSKKLLLKLLLIAIIIILYCQKEIQSEEFYGNISKIDYLTGNYAPEKILASYANPREKTKVFLRKETVGALENMLRDFEDEKKIPLKQHIFITSGFRSYNSQKTIWEEKFSGKRKMRLPVKGKKPDEINALILEYSSAPGTSRHHWGTDFDINILTNDYYKKGGRGEYIYAWLKENAAKYGFCQPYTAYAERNNKGYFEERWHWSYYPLSSRFTHDWISSYNEGRISFKGKFLGSDYLNQLPLLYVKSINPECFK